MNRRALVVVVPEAESVVGVHRQQHDPMAVRGVPAHVTVLHPFRPEIDGATWAAVAQLAARLPAFDATFPATATFPGGVVWLDPHPHDRWHTLLIETHATFPDCPPYGGSIAEPIAHMTVAQAIDDAEAGPLIDALFEQLPVRARVEELTLLVEDVDGRWTVGESWPFLGPAT